MKNQSSALMQLGRELRESVQAGAALAALSLAAGCGGKDVTAAEVDGSEQSATTNQPSTTTVTHPGSSDSPPANPEDTSPPVSLPTEPYPLAQLGCFGPIYDGYSPGAQCCFEAQCYAPGAGEACATPDEAVLRNRIQLPPGSGSCSCSVPSERLEYLSGPFAPNPADGAERAASASAGSCCYLVGAIGCTGRPLCVDGVQLVADAVARVDWLPG
jgi:hypothetical protein